MPQQTPRRPLVQRLQTILVTLFILCFSLALISCDPPPDKEFTPEDKKADFEWMFAIFDNNYAPLEYKFERAGIPKEKFADEFKKFKARYLRAAKATKNNQEFYDLVHQFVSEFADAHTADSFLISNLPGRVSVHYLGFSGVRKGNALLVTSLLPTISLDKSKYPIEVGDLITHVNGVPITEYTLKEMTRFRNLGDDAANLTVLMNRIFNRLSIENGIPKERNISLTVLSGALKKEVTLPWIQKDLYQFKLEQSSVKNALDGNLKNLSIQDREGKESDFLISFVDFEGNPVQLNLSRLKEQPTSKFLSKAFKHLRSFRFQRPISGWTVSSSEMAAKPLKGQDLLNSERTFDSSLNATVFPVQEAQTFPAVISVRNKINKAGKSTGQKEMVGYLRIPTFSPSGVDEATVLNELYATLAKFQEVGVKDIVIDLLNNGGGSLSLVYQVAQAFSNKKILTHGIQFKLNQNWVDDLHRGEIWGPSDTEREIQRRLREKLIEDRSVGKRISDVHSIEEIMPFALKPNLSLEKDFNIVLLTNEMCASAADIFASLMKGNGLAVLLGTKTMGAGGNVVDYSMSDQAPVSHIHLRQTESLLIELDGKTKIENNGITPNVELETSQFVDSRYTPVIGAGFKLLQNKPLFKKHLKDNQALAKKHKRISCEHSLEIEERPMPALAKMLLGLMKK